MSDYLPHVIPALLLAIALVAYMLFQRRRMPAAHDAQNAGYRAGRLAERLGLTLVEGDPEFNLWITQSNEDIGRGPSDGRPVHVQVRMQGTRAGTPFEFLYLFRIEQKTHFTTVTRRRWFDCRMIAHAGRAFPPFEVVSRTTPLGPVLPTQPLPAQPTGNPAADAAYAVTTAEPRVAQVLGSLLPDLKLLASSGVHLVGDGKTVAFVMQQDKAPLIASTLYHAEAVADQLVNVVRAIGS